MAQFQESFYHCPKCNEKVHAAGPFKGAVCLKCNGVEQWQPTMMKIAASMRKANSQSQAIQTAMMVLHQKGIYAQFMQLYGPHLMHSFVSHNQPQKSQNNDVNIHSNDEEDSKSIEEDKADVKKGPAQYAGFNDKTAKYAKDHALPKSSGKCAQYVRQAIEANLIGDKKLTRHSSAKDYGSSLKEVGYKVCSKGSGKTIDNNKLSVGDVIIFDAVSGHNHGHIQIFDGNQHISDFVQKTPYPWNHVGDWTRYRV